MRIGTNIYLVQGALRSALYDDNNKTCYPLSADQDAILRCLSKGRRPNHKSLGISSGSFWNEITEMRKRGWVVAGSPRPSAIEPPANEVESEFRPPERFQHIWLEMTDSCNLKCAHCYANSGPHRARTGELAVQQWIDIVDKFIDTGVDQFTFIGGEPTIRMDVVKDVARHIRQRSPDTVICIFSNLVSIRSLDTLIPELQEYGIRIGTSLYGNTATQHDQVTLRPGSWKKTTDNITSLLAAGIRVFVGIYADLSKDDGMQEALSDWASAFGLVHFDVISTAQVGRGQNLSWARLPEVNQIPDRMTYGFLEWERSGAYHNCFHDHLAIGATGEVMSCIMQRETDIGNVTDLSLNEILSSAAYQKRARLGKDHIDGCSVCEFRYSCFDCRPESTGNSGDLLRKPDCGYDPRLPIGAPL